MKLSKLTTALRSETLPQLALEAAWRAVRSTRQAAFRVTSLSSKCPVHFRPIGYYQLQKEAVSAEARDHIVAYADSIVAGNFPLLGYGSPHLGPRPDWHCDWVSEKSWPLAPSRTLQIVRHDGSDVKAPWELSRLQWAPVVAKAWVLTGHPQYRERLQSLLTDWIAENPLGKGVNWTIAMEAALRGISLCLTMELLWPFTPAEQPFLDLLEKSLWQHLRFIEANNEFSWLVRSNHYLSNLTGLTTLSAYLRGAGMRRRCERYARALQQEVLLQTYADGGDREASSGYHVLVTQMALHSLVVQTRAGCAMEPAFRVRLHLMLRWITTLADDHWTLPVIGDCDNGRVELLLDDISQAGLDASQRHGLRVGSLAGLGSHLLQVPLGGQPQDAVWFGCKDFASLGERHLDGLATLPDSGVAVLRSGDACLIFCAMPNGLSGKGSHTHCDKLSFILRLRNGMQEDEVFLDAGSRGYTRSAEERNIDRSTLAHNTLCVDGEEQNTISLDPHLLFRSGNEATVSPITLQPAAVEASHAGYTRFGVKHHRMARLCDGSLQLIDEITGSDGGQQHQLDLHFMLGVGWTASSEMMEGQRVSCQVMGPRQVTLECTSASHLELTISPASISREYGASLPATSLRIRTAACLPASLRTEVRWS